MRQNKGSKKFWNLICRAAAVLSVSALIFCTPAEAFAETSAAASSDELIEMDSNESTTEESADDTNTDEELITSEEDASTGEMPAEDETGKEELIEDSGTDLISENDDGSTSNTGINKSIEEEIVSDDSAENATNEIGNDSNSEESINGEDDAENSSTISEEIPRSLYLLRKASAPNETTQESENYSQAFSYTGSVQEWTAPYTGWYLLYGKGGGSLGTYPCGGAAAYGVFKINEGQTLYIYVGGQGKAGTSNSRGAGGWNGGGTSGTAPNAGPGTGKAICSGGGGATDFRTQKASTSEPSSDNASLQTRILTAAGSSGGGAHGISGNCGLPNGSVGSRTNDYGEQWNSGSAATTTSAGKFSNRGGGGSGSFGKGGSCTEHGGGAGGGWYGGAAMNVAGACGSSSYVVSTFEDNEVKKIRYTPSRNTGKSSTGIASITLISTEDDCDFYTVSFDANGGSGTMDITYMEAGKGGNLPANTFTRTNYEFSAWNTKADRTGDEYDDKSYFTPTADVTLYAQWEQPYTIAFNANGGTGSMAKQVISFHVPTKLHANTFTNKDKIFTGWNTKADGTGTAYEDEQELTKAYKGNTTTTLYAQWEYSEPQAYAVLGDDGTLCFIRSKTIVANNTVIPSSSIKSVTNIQGNGYTGRFFAGYNGFETKTYDLGNNKTPWYNYRGSIKAVKFVDEIKPVGVACWFAEIQAENVTKADLAELDTSKVTSMNNFFYHCTKLESLDLSGLDTSNVTNMSQIVDGNGSTALTTLTLGKIDTSKVKSFYYAFARNTQLND